MEPEQASTESTEKPQPTINPLIPDGIENFVPSCVVCRSAVPRKRATGRSKDTCSPACHAVLRAFRKHVLMSSHCPACYHPSTPAERKEFLAWRKARGDRREKPGRPPKSKLPVEVPDESEITRDILLLYPLEVPLDVIRRWTDEQRQEAQEWAGAAHVRASDNPHVKVPPRPEFLKEFTATQAVDIMFTRATPTAINDFAHITPKNVEHVRDGGKPVVELCGFGGYCGQHAFHTGDHDQDPKEKAKNADVAEHFKTRRVSAGSRTRRTKVNA